VRSASECCRATAGRCWTLNVRILYRRVANLAKRWKTCWKEQERTPTRLSTVLSIRIRSCKKPQMGLVRLRRLTGTWQHNQAIIVSRRNPPYDFGNGKPMNRKFVILIFVALASALAGCSFNKTASMTARAGSAMTLGTYAYAAPPQRYIAERHKLEVTTSESELQKSWESAVSFCGTIQCEVLSSSIATRVGNSVPSGVISLRVTPDDLKLN